MNSQSNAKAPHITQIHMKQVKFEKDLMHTIGQIRATSRSNGWICTRTNDGIQEGLEGYHTIEFNVKRWHSHNHRQEDVFRVLTNIVAKTVPNV